MKILHINSYFSTSCFYKNLFECQIENNHQIDVFVPVASSFQHDNFDYGPYTKISKNHNKYDRLFFHVKHKKILKDIQVQYDIPRYSIIHAHSLFSNGYIAMHLKKKYKIPYIVAVRNTDVNVFFKKMYHLRKLGIEILSEANHVIFLSTVYKNYVLDRFIPAGKRDSIEKKASIIPNGIDSFWHNNIGTAKEIFNKSKIRLLQIGDIDKNKNVVTSVNVIKRLQKMGIEAELNLVGKVKNNHIYDSIKSIDHVNYLGYKTRDELVNIYRENDIFILPSITETFGLVYAEAMSQGLPVIYSKGQGFDGQFPDGVIGYSVDSLDVEDIVFKVLAILEDYQSITQNCISKSKKFDWRIISDDYYKIYRSLLF